MTNCRLLALAIVFLVLSPNVIANTFEQDGTLEREPFEFVLSQDGTHLTDSTDDLVLFDAQNRFTPPDIIVDITTMNITQSDTAWNVTFEIAEPLPENPGMPINFDIFFDRDNNAMNNATSGVYRVGSDTIAMILFGTATKWHSKLWFYEPALKRFIEQDIKLDYTIGTTQFTIEIPYSVLPAEARVPIRGFSLSNQNKITAIDVIPGYGLPSVRQAIAVPNNSSAPVHTVANTDSKNSSPLFNSILIVLALGIFALIAVIVSPFDFKGRN